MNPSQTDVENAALAMAEFYASAAERSDLPLEKVLLPLARQLATLSAMFEEVKDEADRDQLTGLMSRRRVLNQLDMELERTLRQGTSTAVIMIDLDHFKRVNDEHGHVVGDLVLSEVGRVVREQIRTTDSAGRYGGEELIVVLSGSTDPVAAAEKIREAIRALRITTDTGEVVIPTASLGVSEVKGTSIEPHRAMTLIERADAALYQAKSSGRDRVAQTKRI